MMPDFDRSEWINLYLKEQLKGKDLSVFKEALQNDPDFAQSVSILKQVRDAMSEKDILDFRANLQDITNRIHQQQASKVKKIPIRRIFLAAAIIVGLTIGSYFLYNYFLTPTPTTEQLYADYFVKPDLAIPTSRSESANSWEQINEFYTKGNYTEALQYLQNINNSNMTKNQALYYENLGYTYLVLNQPENAVSAFLTSLDAAPSGEVHWYCAIAYLKMHRISESKQQLRNVLQLGSAERQKKAKKLLQNINKY